MLGRAFLCEILHPEGHIGERCKDWEPFFMLPMPLVATECMFVHRDANVCDANCASSVRIAKRPGARGVLTVVSADSHLFYTYMFAVFI